MRVSSSGPRSTGTGTSTGGAARSSPGHPVLGVRHAPMTNHTVITPGYFKTPGIPSSRHARLRASAMSARVPGGAAA